MDKRSLLFSVLALAIACHCGTTLAAEAGDHRVATGIHEVADQELAGMRGRYIVGDNTVLWFGVEMISTWQTSNGQTLQSALTLGLNFSKNPNQPQVTFVPTVTITTLSNALPTATLPSSVNRSVQSGGLANVGGLTQSVQIAGDGNAASNVTSLSIQNNGKVPGQSSTSSNTPASTPSQPDALSGDANSTASTASIATNGPTVNTRSSTTTATATPTTANTTTPTVATTTGTGTPDGRVASAGNASASATYSGNSAQVNLSVSGQGSVSQWIRPGSIGQTIALTADNQAVTNQMIVSMVTQSINATTSQLAHGLAQSLNMNRSNH
ncbi:hypothetical protein ACFONN_09865 [Dyella humi]|uniref:Uncharacterized protein n=1 Tax=Dyella humi TaxID=1770547 RepID=A0ABW8IQJ2_9GAMM